MKADYWLRVVHGSACFALGAHNGIVVMTPPIAWKRAYGKPVNEVITYYLSRGAKVEVLRL